jgi:hypothetical protein
MHRLRPGLREIDDRQAAVGEPGSSPLFQEDPFRVGSAVAKALGHPPQDIFFATCAGAGDEPRYPAHR